MAADAQAIARAFAPYAAIEEFQNVVQLHTKKNPLFLRRNLSYSATHQSRTERDQKSTSILHLHLEPLNAPAGYSNSITVVAAVCAVLQGDDALMVPLAAKVARVGLKSPQTSQEQAGITSPAGGKSQGVTLSMKVPFAQGTLPKDIVVVLLHKRDRCISRIVRHITKAKHRGTEWNATGREVTCTIKDNHAFQWYQSGANILFATVHPSEEMMEIPPPTTTTGKNNNTKIASPSSLGGTTTANPFLFSRTNANCTIPLNTQGMHTKRGTIELQPGILQTHTPFLDEDGDTIPSNFCIKNGAIGDATPMLRYLLTLEGLPAVKKRKRDSLGGLASPGNNNGRGGANSNMPKQLANKVYPQPLTVNMCSFDGSLRLSTKLQHGYSCPFESCGLKCRGSVGALQQHLVASHPYYEYFVTKSDDHGAELWVRCRKEWFGANGAFLPASGVAKIPPPSSTTASGASGAAAATTTTGGVSPTHPLTMLLQKTATSLPFQYFCCEEQKRYRNNEGGSYPIDPQEDRLEEMARVVAESVAEASIAAAAAEGGAAANNNPNNGLFVWDNADLAPTEHEIEEGRTEFNSEFEDSGVAAGGGGGGNNNRNGGFKGTSARPPRPPPGRQRSGPLHLSRQQSLIPTKLPLTDNNGLPKFYHRSRCMAMTEKELEINAGDSDDDSDTEQYIRYCSTALEEKPNLCKEEMEFMLTWNNYTLKNPIHADYAVPDACIVFTKEHKEMLKDAGGWFRRCFAAHVLNLWKFRLLTPAQMHAVLVAAGGQSGEDGGVEEKFEMPTEV